MIKHATQRFTELLKYKSKDSEKHNWNEGKKREKKS